MSLFCRRQSSSPRLFLDCIIISIAYYYFIYLATVAASIAFKSFAKLGTLFGDFMMMMMNSKYQSLSLVTKKMVLFLVLMTTMMLGSTSTTTHAFTFPTTTTTTTTTSSHVVSPLYVRKINDNEIPMKKMTTERRKKLGIADDEDEYDLGMALDNNTDPFITKVIAGSFILAMIVALVAGIIIPATTDYGEGVCNPILTGGRC